MSIKFKNNKPFFEGVNINDITKNYTTPFYLYSQEEISKTYALLKKHLSSEIYFAIKANSNQALLKVLKNNGSGADVVSIGELKKSLKAGFHPKKIIFEGVGKSKEDIEYAINKKILLINIESFEELEIINSIGKELNKKIDIGVRFNPNINSQSIKKISTGNKTDKFGVDLKCVKQIVSKINSYSNINLKGISCHVGSQISNIKVFKHTFLKMKNVASFLISKNFKLEYVDLGGGFPVNYNDKKNTFDLKSIGKLVNSIFKNTPYRTSFEPGRFIIAKAGILITKILTTKKNGGINFLITDAGMHTFIRPAMYESYHNIKALNNLKSEKISYTIAGPICESSDIINKKIILPKQKSGNYLVIQDVGAYGAVMSSNYNSRGLPIEILVYKNKFSVINIGEKLSDSIKREKIPKWL